MSTVLLFSCGKKLNTLTYDREILNEQLPFDNDINLAKNFVVTEHARPMIDENIDLEMAKMIRMCWLHNPEQRPSFTYIYSKLK